MGRITSFKDLGCLVTGASAGIGRDIAHILASEGARLVLTARREDRLRALAEECRELGAPAAYALPYDLADPATPDALAQMAENHLGHVDVLINNAGFAEPGLFHLTDRTRLMTMLQVNIAASVALAHRLLPGMVERDSGAILNVASMAGFQASPYTSAYGGTKAFLLNWSNGLHQEYKESGIAISALCPGVTDTEFFEAAGYRNLTGFLNKRAASRPVAQAGLDALRSGRMDVVPGTLNAFSIFMERFFPRTFVASISRRLMGGRPFPTRKQKP